MPEETLVLSYDDILNLTAILIPSYRRSVKVSASMSEMWCIGRGKGVWITLGMIVSRLLGVCVQGFQKGKVVPGEWQSRRVHLVGSGEMKTTGLIHQSVNLSTPTLVHLGIQRFLLILSLSKPIKSGEKEMLLSSTLPCILVLSFFPFGYCAFHGFYL